MAYWMFGFKLNNQKFPLEKLNASVMPVKFRHYWFSSDVHVTSKNMPETFLFDSNMHMMRKKFSSKFLTRFKICMWCPKKAVSRVWFNSNRHWCPKTLFHSDWTIKWSKDLWVQTFPKKVFHFKFNHLSSLKCCFEWFRFSLCIWCSITSEIVLIQFKHAYND